MFENLPRKVKVVEVGLRDGLQNEAKHVATEDKLRLLQALADTGLKQIEITSFVSPKWIPQLADAERLCQVMQLPQTVRAVALVPNLQGLVRAKTCGIQNIAVFLSASESHSRRNINKSITEALANTRAVVEQAKAERFWVRAYLSVVFACPYEGPISVEQVLGIVKDLASAGVDEISLGDTIGAAGPKDVWNLLQRLQEIIDLSTIALHFHDTKGTALANVLAGLEAGVTVYDASVGGMGGCPYAPGAAGNLASEDLVHLLDSLGIASGVSLKKLVQCGELAQEILGRDLPGRYLRSYLGEASLTK